uniref:Amidohydrolase-related domain-containing protein n=1 Tax=Rhizochromulina marina TaxID=1034831 RepID=A0A7S2SDE5_9STRA
MVPEAAVVVYGDGTIQDILVTGDVRAQVRELGPVSKTVPVAAPGFIMPGLVDCHIHAPQYAFTGTGLDLPLMGPHGWLETYTFPVERRMVMDMAHAVRVYSAVVKRTLRSGTTTAAYFGTLHLLPTKALVVILQHYGQRALVGKVCMDRHSPENYCQPLEENLRETQEFVAFCPPTMPTAPGAAALVQPCITPRFVPACSSELQRGLASLAEEHGGLHIQTHVAESIDEVAFCRLLDEREPTCPGYGRDASILDAHGLLTSKTILAHGCHLSPAEITLLAARSSSVAHCPLSNAYFADAVLPVRRLLEAGVRVGLGSDVAGGYEPSMLAAIRACVISSKFLQAGVDHYDHIGGPTTSGPGGPVTSTGGPSPGALEGRNRSSPPASTHGEPPLKRGRPSGGGVGGAANNLREPSEVGFKEAFFLATAGGARALAMEDTVGSLEVGQAFDALVVQPGRSSQRSGLDLFPGDSLETAVEKFLHCGDDRDISQVYVQGRQVLCDGAFDCDDIQVDAVLQALSARTGSEGKVEPN